ncbi:MAG: beta-glucosidase BglX [Bacteroidales bacterium]|nr:beta-glucosidase BglX [Bacteroidales bacterium]MBP3661999.1 beta-glucosidase BglX [Bacteroidales bacterium]
MRGISIFLSAVFLLSACVPEKTKVDELMSQMTLEEKLGQLNCLVAPRGAVTGEQQSTGVAEKVRSGAVGSLFGRHDRDELMAWQKMAVEESRLGIPLLFGADIIHGYRTTFPVPLALAATWNPESMERAARISTVEASSDGLTWLYNPMVDICRDPRWGRCVEGAGEDPYLASVYSETMVRGIQGDLKADDEILACVKHFALYGASEAGRDYRETDMSPARMYNEYFPPYKAAVDAGVASIMSSFNDVNGIPATGNRWLMTEVLRNQWGFDGFVVSDYNAVGEMVRHGIGDRKTVSELALNAGVDSDMMTEGFVGELAASVKEGRVSMKAVDQACRRVLEAKEKLGLLDDPYKFLRCEQNRIYTDEHRKAAREIAAESFVLLKNDGTLPLSKGKKVALVGPLADAGAQYTGSWQGAAYDDCRSLLAAMKEAGCDFVFAKGSNMLEDAELEQAACRNRKYVRDPRSESQMIREAVAAARQSDVVLAAVGEPAWMTGEASSRTSLDIPQPQKRLLEALVNTGRPVVLLLFSGRPMTLEWEDSNMAAILDVWYGGSEAADAILDVVYGRVNPSGKLTMTFPRNVGQIPLYYNMKNGGRPAKTDSYKRFSSCYMDSPNSPLYPFGYGLSYTTFEYTDFALSADAMPSDGSVTASVKVTNTGSRDADETVQLYIHDVYSSMTRPVKELKAFRKVRVKAGETVEVSFEITPDLLSWYYVDPFETGAPQLALEPGDFEIMVGPDSSTLQTLMLNVLE